MTKQTHADGTYTLTAGEGYNLAVIVDGVEQARTKVVEIPAAGTLNDWVEVPEPEPAEETTEQRIARLRAEIEALESLTT